MTPPPPIVVIDDDPDMLGALVQNLRLTGYAVDAHSSALSALATLSREFSEVVLSDLRMPDIDGIGVLQRCALIDPDLPVILISVHADVEIPM
jgi:two-component system C4-dicarboxylate transport response regulator DctD